MTKKIKDKFRDNEVEGKRKRNKEKKRGMEEGKVEPGTKI